jgi:ABC-2 type transport system ATP-binding protein
MLTSSIEPETHPAQPALAIESLSKCYGDVLALDQLSLHVQAGEVVCLLGANGAGKTTAIHALLGFIEPTSGCARVFGMDVRRHTSAARRRLGFIPELVVLYEQLSGRENLELLCALGGATLPPAELEQILIDAGLPHAALDRRVDTYSKGMRQKVGLGLALARGAQALLLDEPLSGLDPKAASELIDTVRRHADAGAAVLMATHDLHRAVEVATRIGIVKAGRLVDVLQARALSSADLERIYLEHMRL